jgi:AefR-like transcriptional repressor, C-terminal domain
VGWRGLRSQENPEREPVGNQQERHQQRRNEVRRSELPGDQPPPHCLTDPTVIAVYRMAIAEAINSPEVAQALDSIGREASRAALRQIMAGALAGRLLTGRPTELAEQFGGLLWGHLMINLLLGVVERPNRRESAARSLAAGTAFLELHPLPASRDELRSRVSARAAGS